jgi:hypothetical protein
VNKPSNLTREQLVHIVEKVQKVLYWDMNAQEQMFWNLDKEWDSETMAQVAGVLTDAGLAPQQA